jgi:hypothetical protein
MKETAFGIPDEADKHRSPDTQLLLDHGLYRSDRSDRFASGMPKIRKEVFALIKFRLRRFRRDGR